MGLAEITAKGVREAVEEFDQIGRDAFLAKYGFGKSRQYFLVVAGKRYDSKAIAGAAYRYDYLDREPLQASDFSGGHKRTAHVLRELGFEVVSGQEQSLQDPAHYAVLVNPTKYRIEDAVRELITDTWVTAGRPMKPGDRVVIWKAKGRDEHRGIVALGEVVTQPAVTPDADNPYWQPGAAGQEEEVERVIVRYAVPAGLPVWEGGEHDELLAELSVSRATGGTVFNVTPDQWDRVVEVAGDWNADLVFWPALLQGMRRSKPHYKPAALLVAVEEILSTGVGRVPCETVAAGFDQIMEELDPDGVGKAWEPLYHLSDDTDGTTGAWTLFLGGERSTFEKRPKSESGLTAQADHAVLRPDLLQELSHSPREVRRLIAGYLRSQSPDDDLKPQRRSSQGRNLSPGKRKAIEEWAVLRAIEQFPDLDLQDVGATERYDLEDTSVTPPIRIEVKGSTLRLDKITLTDNEVEHAKEARDNGICRLILVIVEGIELVAGDGEDEWIASGGEVRVWDPWVLDEGGLEPVQWRLRLDDEDAAKEIDQ